MTSLDNEKRDNIVTAKVADDAQNLDNKAHVKALEVSDENPSTLYNDVEIDASHAEQESEPLDFIVEEVPAIGTAKPFSADTEMSVVDIEAHSAIMQADVKLEEIRQEPVMLMKASEEESQEFSAVDPHIDAIASEGEDEKKEDQVTRSSSIKPVRGSKLGMGWFQGFNLFICGVIFIGLAIFAYFMFGESPLYSGKLPKYVVVETEDSASMGVLNPAIPLDERAQYIYVPKVERGDDLEAPVLDAEDTVKTVTKVELLSDGSVESEGGIETEVVSSMDQEAQNNTPAFELLSTDHTEKGLSEEDVEMVKLFNQQAGYAFMQGNYVGVDFNDAYYYYQEALKLDPESIAALNGLIAIADIYYRSAVDTYNQGNMDIAEQYLAIGLKVLPDYAPLLQLKGLIEQNSFIAPAQNSFAPVDGFQFE